jgi:hypothetical protein
MNSLSGSLSFSLFLYHSLSCARARALSRCLLSPCLSLFEKLFAALAAATPEGGGGGGGGGSGGTETRSGIEKEEKGLIQGNEMNKVGV